ncbi:cell wall-binding repeat-containing protein [Knoellia sp. LjRoot47]|uniref:cell wall-binding repeat-containing protein n=1 Tax=Knoellia sp. LjRoot47 TaxID=3342330 RepID=UPI003ED02C1B
MTAPATAAPPRVERAASTSWDSLQKRAQASEQRLRAKTVVAGRPGAPGSDAGASGAREAAAFDGEIWVEGFPSSVVLNPITGASRPMPRIGAEAAHDVSVGPAGDRISTLRTRLVNPGEEPPVIVDTYVDFAHEDGTYPVIGAGFFGESADRGQWSPMGDVTYHSLNPGDGPGGEGIGFASPAGKQRVHGEESTNRTIAEPVVTPHNDLLVSGNGYVATLDSDAVHSPEGSDVVGDFESLGLEQYQPRQVSVALAPGDSLANEDATTYLAFDGLDLSTPDPTDRRIYVDHADGRGPVAASPSTNADNWPVNPTLSPSGSQIAYVKRSSDPNSVTTLGVISAGPSGTFDVSTATERTFPLTSLGANPTVAHLSWAPATPAAASLRIAGANRRAVAINTSMAFFDDGTANLAVVAGDQAEADALSSTPLAGEFNGPVLLTSQSALSAGVGSELDRVLATGATIYVTGGPASVSTAVENQLRQLGHPVVRLGGANRYEVSVNIARRMDQLRGSHADTVMVAAGSAFADALAAGPAAVTRQAPVVLSNGSTLPAVTKAYVDEVIAADGKAYGIGGTGGRSVEGYPFEQREVISGADRYRVAANVADFFFSPSSTVGIADGRNWPDAVSGGAAMALIGQPILLNGGTSLHPATREHIRRIRSSADAVLTFGGAASVPESAVTTAVAVAGRQTVYYGPDTR